MASLMLFVCVLYLAFFTNSIFKTMELYVIIFMLQNYYYFYVYYSFLLQSSSSSLLPTLLIDGSDANSRKFLQKRFFFLFLLRQLSFSNMVKVSALFSSVAFTILTFLEKNHFKIQWDYRYDILLLRFVSPTQYSSKKSLYWDYFNFIDQWPDQLYVRKIYIWQVFRR